MESVKHWTGQPLRSRHSKRQNQGSREIKLHSSCTMTSGAAALQNGQGGEPPTSLPQRQQPIVSQSPANRLRCKDARNVSDEQAHWFLVHHPAI